MDLSRNSHDALRAHDDFSDEFWWGGHKVTSQLQALPEMKPVKRAYNKSQK